MKKRIWGKIAGAFLGFAISGPLGMILGTIVGHLHDTNPDILTNPWGKNSNTYSGFSGTSQQVTFTVGVIVLGAKMAKADGRVTRAEVEAFKRVFRIKPEQVAQVGRIFDEARQSAAGYEPYAYQLAQTFRYSPMVLEEVLSGLFLIAAADSAGLSPAELAFLKKIAVIFSFDKEDFIRIAMRVGVKVPYTDTKVVKEQDESYAILGIKEDATPDDIKSAYRALTRKYHPDMLMSQGLPPEYIATASEKMKRINVAYEAICKIRSIK